MKSTNKSERILNSLNGIQKAGAPDFFYTRLMGRMQNEMEEPKPFLLFRPAFVTAALFVLLIINVFSIVKFSKVAEPKATVQSPGTATIESFANAYNMNTESVYE